MAEPYIGEVRMLALSYAPRNYALCNGQLMSIQQSSALYSILGTTFGGDGKSNFALPDLRGRTPIGAGTGPNLTPVKLGEQGGKETDTLDYDTLAFHTHAIVATSESATQNRPTGNQLAAGVPATARAYAPPGGPLVSLADETVLPYPDAAQPHPNRQPYLTINFCIAIQGTFPPRN